MEQRVIPLSLLLTVHTIQVHVQSLIKLQLAFYRNMKLSKGQPKKFKGKLNSISLQQQLAFKTTINYQNGVYDDKQIVIQMACQIDSVRHVFEKVLALRQFIDQIPKKKTMALNDNPKVKIHYTLQVRQSKQDSKNHKTMKPIYPNNILKNSPQKKNKNDKAQTNQDSIIENEPQLKKTKTQGQFQENIKQPQRKQKRNKQMTMMVDSPRKKNRTTTGQQRIKSNRSEKKDEQLSNIVQLGPQKQQNIDKAQLLKLRQQVLKLNSILNSKKQDQKKVKQKYQQEIKNLKDVVNTLKNEKIKLQESLKKADTLKKRKDSTDKLQQQIKILKLKIKEYQQEIHGLLSNKKQYKLKLDAYEDLTTQFQLLSQKNQAISNNLAETQEKLDKLTQELDELKNEKNQLQQQNNKLLKDLNQTKNKRNSIISNMSKDFEGSEMTKKLKTQIQDLKQQLEKTLKLVTQKEKLIKVLNQCKDESQRQRDQTIERLTNEVYYLKEQIKAKESKSNIHNDGSLIQVQLMLQKTKKQLQMVKKAEKIIVAEKGNLQAKSRSMQEQLVKIKGMIASLLNAVHQYADQQTATAITQCIQEN